MPKYVYIQMYAREGAPAAPPIKIRADKVQQPQGGGNMVFLLGNEKIGEFNPAQIAGWWIFDDE